MTAADAAVVEQLQLLCGPHADSVLPAHVVRHLQPIAWFGDLSSADDVDGPTLHALLG